MKGWGVKPLSRRGPAPSREGLGGKPLSRTGPAPSGRVSNPCQAAPSREWLGGLSFCEEGGRLQVVTGWGGAGGGGRWVKSLSRRTGSKSCRDNNDCSSSKGQIQGRLALDFRPLLPAAPGREGLGGPNPCQEAGRLQVVKGWSNRCHVWEKQPHKSV